MKYRKLISCFAFVLVFYLFGCAGDMTGMGRSEAGRGTGYATLDLTIGVLPVSGSLNPDQNMHPGLAGALDSYHFFKSIEPVASAPNRKFDLLLVCEPPGFAPEMKVLSGYSGKELFRKKVTALYGTGGYPRAARELARAFAVGSPLYQEITAEREVFKRQSAYASAGNTAAVAAPVQSDIDRPFFEERQKVFGEQDLAVVIGIEQYQQLPASAFSLSDAALVKEYLVSLGMKERNIELVTNGQATYSAILKLIEAWLLNRAGKDSRIFVYYSGHGSPDPVSGDAFMVPFDGDPNYPAETCYPLKRLSDKLARIPAREKMIVLDACFSGAGGRSVLARGARPLVMTAAELKLPGDMAILTASQGAQISASSPEKGHGIFTYYFLKAIREGNGSLADIYLYARPRIEDEARRLNVRQSPRLDPAPENSAGKFLLRK